MRKLLKSVEVMEILGLKESTFYKKRKEGVIPPPTYKLGKKQPRWDSEEIYKLFNN